MRAALRKMGNSQGVIIPKALIGQFGFEDEIEMSVTPEGIMLAKPNKQPRVGWAASSRRLAKTDDDALIWPEFGNDDDEELAW